MPRSTIVAVGQVEPLLMQIALDEDNTTTSRSVVIAMERM
jgi:hypothetical protein